MQEENRFIEGIFRRHERGFGFVIVEDQEDDIYIAKEDSKDAFSGDRVLVKLKKKSNGARQEGIILKVIEHKKDTLVGTFQKNKNFGFVIPDDKKLCRTKAGKQKRWTIILGVIFAILTIILGIVFMLIK